MSIIFVIIRWAIRIGGLVYASVTPDHASAMYTYLGIEFGASVISLARFEGDSVMKVVTGFDGSGDTGYYSHTDNSGVRVFGYLAWFAAVVMRALLISVLFGWYKLSIDEEAITTALRLLA